MKDREPLYPYEWDLLKDLLHWGGAGQGGDVHLLALSPQDLFHRFEERLELTVGHDDDDGGLILTGTKALFILFIYFNFPFSGAFCTCCELAQF